MLKIFSLAVIEERNKYFDIDRNRLKKLNFEFDKTFEDIENELDFHGYGTAKIEIQQQPDDINPFTYELHQTLFDLLDFNPALKVINITLAYESDENDIDFGEAEKNDRLVLIMTLARERSASTNKKVITGS